MLPLILLLPLLLTLPVQQLPSGLLLLSIILVLGQLPRELVDLGVKLELADGIIDRLLFGLQSILRCLIELEALSGLCHLS